MFIVYRADDTDVYIGLWNFQYIPLENLFPVAVCQSGILSDRFGIDLVIVERVASRRKSVCYDEMQPAIHEIVTI